jgi:hypothetical protein
MKSYREKLLWYTPLGVVDLYLPQAVREGVLVKLEIIETQNGMMVLASWYCSKLNPESQG